MPRLAGLGGDTSPTMLQLNVPTHCMVGYTQDLQAWFPNLEMASNLLASHSGCLAKNPTAEAALTSRLDFPGLVRRGG
jgi:hypothetical protein